MCIRDSLQCLPTAENLCVDFEPSVKLLPPADFAVRSWSTVDGRATSVTARVNVRADVVGGTCGGE
eukprot:988522-Prorocentrum_lima.AAC.1